MPKFDALRGKVVNGHIVFPMGGDTQAVYTLKNNGLKEDIVVPKVTETTMSFSYELRLPKTLEVRALPDRSGGIGIYSVDPSLYGDIAFGSDKDRQEVEKARINGDKTYLVFGLPAPVVKDTAGKEAGSARFELDGNRLSVVAEDLKSDVGPITIDPSVVVTSTSDFQTQGNNEGMIDFGTSGQITRGGLTGGTMGTWSTTGNSYFSSCAGAATAAYNGYLYTSGCSGGDQTVQYAAINSNGTLGNYASTTSMGTTRMFHRLEAYNGYLYAIGGASGISTYYNTVEYAPIASNGTVGTWRSTSSFTTTRSALASAVYNGYLYIMGGYDGSNPKNDVQYVAVKADGSLGSWASTTSFTTTRSSLGGFAYNGYLYIMGGYNAASTYYSDVQYAKIANDGTVGSWAATTSFSTARAAPQVTVYNGYAYVMGGTTNTTSARTDTQYAQINANGTLGTWLTSSALNTGVWAAGTAAYNGYLYIATGRTTNVSIIATTQYAAIDQAGKPVAFGTLTNNFTTARALACSVAYNGYLYALGGSTSDSGSQNVTTVQYTALNSSTGNNGSWSSTTALPITIGSAACIAYNGYMYIGSGYTGSGSGSSNVQMYYVAINSNGTLGGTWTTSANSPPGTDRPGLFIYGTSSGTYMYSVQEGNGYNTWISSINSSTGAPGAWNDSGVNTINTYGHRGYAQVGKYLYAFGGLSSGTAYAAVEYTSINNDGSINAWQSTTSMNTATGFTNGTTVNGCIYSVGGETGAGVSMNNVQYACPNANGTISAWYNAPNLTVATTDLGVTSYNGYIYGVGGYTTSVQTTTQFAYVNNGGSGSNGSWAFTTGSLTGGNIYGASTSYNGYIYVTGGDSGSASYNTVQYSQIGATGDLASFSNDAHTFTTARGGHGTVAYNGYLYIVGGSAHGGSPLYGDVQYAPIGSSGALSGNFASTTSFVTGTGSDTARAGSCVVAYNGYIYATGGYDGTSDHADTRYAAINSNGTLGSWADSGNNFTTARDSHGCFVANGYLYIVGGSGASFYNDVQAAPINSNGTLGSWTYTTSFTGPRSVPVVAYSNGFVYIAGGCVNGACSSRYGDTQYAPVLPNGTLGAWRQSTSTIASYSLGAASGVAANGSLYFFGGDGAGSSRDSVYYAPLNSISRTARYSKLVDLGNPVSVSSITYNGVLPTSTSTPGVVPISFRAAGSDGVFGSVTSSSAITAGATACMATSQNYKRYLEVTILLDGSGGQAILPDASGTYANVTDFTVNYITPHPNPNIRLRHGQTMQTGNLSPLDTCWP